MTTENNQQINYQVGDATRPGGDGPKVIVHVCNDIGGWGKGFVMAVSKRWPEPEQRYRAWHAGSESLPFKLGEVQFVKVADNLWVANLIGQRDIRKQKGVPPIRYEAVKEGLTKVAEFARKNKASVHMPRIGAGLAGGDWQTISQIIEAELCAKNIQVTVYNLK